MTDDYDAASSAKFGRQGPRAVDLRALAAEVLARRYNRRPVTAFDLATADEALALLSKDEVIELATPSGPRGGEEGRS